MFDLDGLIKAQVGVPSCHIVKSQLSSLTSLKKDFISLLGIFL